MMSVACLIQSGRAEGALGVSFLAEQWLLLDLAEKVAEAAS